ncbi:hypothetical protein CLOHAE12215_01331 [Clostridium haemolyticum]|uniref:hypothetical protein n=1 Tax=Clostridium haemolyticum TaxID=84025 RepID=UPI001C3B3B9C|nr:hypothetical protein [Clostridium haemolyticum]CAG7839915.1 hypothetical protein CLOHAE12215_01331 [Clostridium haemolyticum]
MLTLIKTLFQFLVIIQVLSLLFTGSTRIGIHLTKNIIIITKNTLKLIVKLTIRQIKFVNKLIYKTTKYKSTIKQNKNKKQYQQEICTYNQKVANGNSNVVDLRSYIKQQ